MTKIQDGHIGQMVAGATMYFMRLGRSRNRFRKGGSQLLIGYLTASVLFSAGCDKSLKPVPVKGVVTFEGKPPPAAGSVYFMPVGPTIQGSVARPGVGDFGTDGRFEVTTIAKGDGLWPGTYRTRVDCWKIAPTAFAPPSESSVPPNYQSPDLVVPTDTAGPIQVEYDVR
jgi:hypothetical protein